MKQARRKKNQTGRGRAFLFTLTVIFLIVAMYLIASGHWHNVYAFFVQFHQRTLWTGLLLFFVPALLVLLLRAWGVEDVPLVEDVPELGSGRFRTLAQRIEQSHRSEYDQALLINELSELATQVIALNEGIDLPAARRLCRYSKWAGDPMILDLIRDRRIPDPAGRRFVTQLETIQHSIETLLTGGTDSESRPSR